MEADGTAVDISFYLPLHAVCTVLFPASKLSRGLEHSQISSEGAEDTTEVIVTITMKLTDKTD